MEAACPLCQFIERPDTITGGVIERTGGFLVIHKEPPVHIPGWIIIVPERHITDQTELTDKEMQALSMLEKKYTSLLRLIFGAQRVYWVCFAEIVRHIHFHLIPRTANIDPAFRGAKIFEPKAGRALSEGEIVATCDRIREDKMGFNLIP
jgi:diadenosine tetraphosphate (Ap4A) HIT family hydrolase